jgi:hypothetical protein
MGGLIEVREKEDAWFARGWLFNRLVERAKASLSDRDDVSALNEALANNGLFLWMQPPDQAARLARSIERAAVELADELRTKREEEIDLAFARQLDELRAQLLPPGSSTSNWTSSP